MRNDLIAVWVIVGSMLLLIAACSYVKVKKDQMKVRRLEEIREACRNKQPIDFVVNLGGH